ncbi:hypothetical protein [Oceanobacillus salinisoli]|uniref:hypothetical protein n=1 Tax=Oceanobacillus salinisoli TaxID=2678611 RepID=UPI0012E1D0A6|nr:hypothetical protein [Oceanobacillus salinisoli]
MNMPNVNGERSILKFIISTSEDIKTKIRNKIFFYEEQIHRYVLKQVELFLYYLYTDRALLTVYKYEIFNSIMFRLKTSMKENLIFKCI